MTTSPAPSVAGTFLGLSPSFGRVVAMLARDEAAALTGQTLTVDGGLVLR